MDEFEVKAFVSFTVRAESQEEAEGWVSGAIEDISDQDTYPLFGHSYFESELLVLDRPNLRLGKYTRCYSELTSDQLNGLLWLLGEWSGRVRYNRSLGKNAGGRRGQAAIDALQEFRRDPIGLEEVKALMRKAAGGIDASSNGKF